MKSDFTALGTAYRTEADKALHRSISFGVILVLAHLLEVKPSAFDGFGFKVAFNDPVIIYGAISLLFGYHLARWMTHTEISESLYPLSVTPRRIRSNLRIARSAYLKEKKGRKKPQTPQELKKTARAFIGILNFILLPYRVIFALFMIAALIYMFIDIFWLVELIIRKSPIATEAITALAQYL